MTEIKIITSDDKIWNKASVYTELTRTIHSKESFAIDLLYEGPDLRTNGLYQYLEDASITLKHITVYTSNALEQHNTINIEYRPPMHLLKKANAYIVEVNKNQTFKHFGLFIGRSNAPRLHLATYLKNHYDNKSMLSYHFNTNDDFHISNIGLEDLIQKYNFQDVQKEAEFISVCPVRLNGNVGIVNNKNSELNHAQQLLNNDKTSFPQQYNNFFVELVCESFFTGNTFFPTEKTFRPMLLKTPFIIQGPQYFLHNLKKLGFKTFDQWWDEGYAEDPPGHQLTEIKKILDVLSTKTQADLYNMYIDMSEILQHNYQTALELTYEDFQRIHCE